MLASITRTSGQKAFFSGITISRARTCSASQFRQHVLKQDFCKSTLYGRHQGKLLNSNLIQQHIGRTVNCRLFNTTPQRNAWPLAALLVKLAGPLSKLSKLAAVVGGRTFRNWWKKLPVHHKEKYLNKGVLLLNKERLIIIIGGFGGICTGFYFFHLEETPFTHRTRFMPVTHMQMNELAVTEHKEILEQFADSILPVNHPDHIRVFHVAQRLIRANKCKEMDHLKWQVNVVFADDQVNAFVLPHGQIFVFTGMLKMFTNNDELASVLGHEIAHAVLQHGAEQVALHGFINLFLILSLATLWALIPTDLLAIGAQWIQNRILSILLHLPYSRKLELEADKVGMYFAAKACFDVRECPKFWSRIALSQKHIEEGGVDVEWLSTHPSHHSRAKKLEEMVPEALELRRLCNCPQLDAIPKLSGRSRPRPLTLAGLVGIH